MTNDGRNHVGVLAANVTRGGNRNSDGAEGHRSGVSQQHGDSCLEDAQGQNHSCGNCDGSAEAG